MSLRLPYYLFAYKIACLLSGVACIYLGYRLFMAGLLDPATLRAANGSVTFSMQNAAPGTFFALFGTVIVGFAVFRGLNFDSSKDEETDSKNNRNNVSVDAAYHWQRTWASLQRLAEEGKISQDELSLIQLDMAGLVTNLPEISDRQVKRSFRKEGFRGFASPPP